MGETTCPKSQDNMHDDNWYDGGRCAFCGDLPTTIFFYDPELNDDDGRDTGFWVVYDVPEGCEDDYSGLSPDHPVDASVFNELFATMAGKPWFRPWDHLPTLRLVNTGAYENAPIVEQWDATEWEPTASLPLKPVQKQLEHVFGAMADQRYHRLDRENDRCVCGGEWVYYEHYCVYREDGSHEDCLPGVYGCECQGHEMAFLFNIDRDNNDRYLGDGW